MRKSSLARFCGLSCSIALPSCFGRQKVTTASRSELGGTRKYSGGTDDRVQTAAAFVTLLRELGEDQQEVASVRDGLAHYMECFEAQINRSKT